MLTVINTLLLGAGNSVFHAERLRYGKVLYKKEDFDWFEKTDDLHKVTNPIKFILFPSIIIFSYLLIRRNFWLFSLSLLLNTYPINIVTVMASNVFVIPLSVVIAKLRGVKL